MDLKWWRWPRRARRPRRVRIYFVDKGNSFRSQVAEAWTHFLGDRSKVEVGSGGFTPAGAVHDQLASLMEERDVRLMAQVPSAIDERWAATADVIVSLDGPLDAAWAAGRRVDVWPIRDVAYGTAADLRRAREKIGKKVYALLKELGALHDGAVGFFEP